MRLRTVHTQMLYRQTECTSKCTPHIPHLHMFIITIQSSLDLHDSRFIHFPHKKKFYINFKVESVVVNFKIYITDMQKKGFSNKP